MKSAQFIRALKSADKRDLSYSIKNFKVNESRLSKTEIVKSLSCTFISIFRFGKAELMLSQGMSVDYTSADGKSFVRGTLHRVDYLDNILINGFHDVEGGRFDLVFLLNQLEQQEIANPRRTNEIIQNLVDLMFEITSIDHENIAKSITNAFDDLVLAMPDVKKLNASAESEGKLIELLLNMKMADLEARVKNMVHRVSQLKIESETQMYQFVSGLVTSIFEIDDFQFFSKYYMERKYPTYSSERLQIQNVLGVNDTDFDEYKELIIESKIGQLTLDLTNEQESIQKLGNNSALFFRLQSIFGFIKRQNKQPDITDKFDDYYLNWLEKAQTPAESPLAPRLNHMFWRPFNYSLPKNEQ